MAKKEKHKASDPDLTVRIERLRKERHDARASEEELKRHVIAYKAAFYEERKARDISAANEAHVREAIKDLRDELAAERKKNGTAWETIYDLLIDADVLSRLRGWYWSAERKEPVYVDGIGKDGLTGFSLGFFAGKFNGSVTDTFDFKDLVRIDVNVATELEY